MIVAWSNNQKQSKNKRFENPINKLDLMDTNSCTQELETTHFSWLFVKQIIKSDNFLGQKTIFDTFYSTGILQFTFSDYKNEHNSIGSALHVQIAGFLLKTKLQ